MEKQVDWSIIRADYEGGMSLRALASKYGISKSVIGEHKYKEKWAERAKERTDISNSGSNTHDINASVRVLAALDLLLKENLSWDEIAARSGYSSRGAAHNAVTRELDRRVTHNISELRTRELYMINQLQARCYKAALDENNQGWTWAVDRFNNLSERKSKLMGLDIKPEETEGKQIIIREVPSGLLPAPVVESKP